MGKGSMRILHIRNVANYAWRLAQAQKALGHDAVVWAQGENPFNFPCDDHIRFNDPVRWNTAMLLRLPEIRDFDVVHIHGGIWRSQVFYRLKFLPVKKAIHYYGTETRTGKGLFHMDITPVHFYTPPDLRRWHPDGICMPLIVDLPPLPLWKPQNETPIFAHFSTSERNKGTLKVIAMFSSAFGPLEHHEMPILQGTKDIYVGKDAELHVFRKITPHSVERVMKQADVIFDQIADFGIYGTISAEAMAHGKPTLATIDRSLYPPDCPVIYPTAAALRELVDNVVLRESMGKRGRAHAEREHAADTVARRVLDAYPD